MCRFSNDALKKHCNQVFKAPRDKDLGYPPNKETRPAGVVVRVRNLKIVRNFRWWIPIKDLRSMASINRECWLAQRSLFCLFKNVKNTHYLMKSVIVPCILGVVSMTSLYMGQRRTVTDPVWPAHIPSPFPFLPMLVQLPAVSTHVPVPEDFLCTVDLSVCRQAKSIGEVLRTWGAVSYKAMNKHVALVIVYWGIHSTMALRWPWGIYLPLFIW